MLLVVALFGLIVPNGLFVTWLLQDFHGWGPVLQDKLALAFILDALLTLVILAVYFAKRPMGRHGWVTFVVLSLIGGLCFSLPLFYWLNTRPAPASAA